MKKQLFSKYTPVCLYHELKEKGFYFDVVETITGEFDESTDKIKTEHYVSLQPPYMDFNWNDFVVGFECETYELLDDGTIIVNDAGKTMGESSIDGVYQINNYWYVKLVGEKIVEMFSVIPFDFYYEVLGCV